MPPFPKADLSSVCQATASGDIETLTVLLTTSDPLTGFQGDINEHQSDKTALHYAAANGMIECVEALLKSKADPHIKTRMPKGSSPADGKTACQAADDMGWDDVVSVLKAAEAKEPKGDYVLGGPFNNAKIYTKATPFGRDPAEVAKLSKKMSSAYKPYFLAEADHPTSIGLLFPGQGSQYVSMLGGVKDIPAVKDMLATAKAVLGWDVLEVCTSGPGSKLDSAEFCQPALFVAGLAALEKLKKDRPEAALRPGAVAGLGVGEMAALVAAGVLPFEDGLKVVKVRAEAMAAASKAGSQAMLTVAGLRRDKVEAFCKELGTGGVCAIAQELFPKGTTCGGDKALMEKLQAKVKENGALQAKLVTTSGAFSTPLMASAVPKVAAVLKEVAPKMKAPTCDVYMNTTGTPVYAGASPKAAVPMILAQLTEPVLWEKCVRSMIGAGITEFYEVGPMRQLKAMMKRIDATMFESTTCVEV
jgi:[acyl-carrier-protein] S-malonyltransferase